jgi:hypothetical protein
MAKASGNTGAVQANSEDSPASVHAIAQRLFTNNWKLRGGVEVWSIAVDAYKAAAEFTAIASKVAAGMSPEDIVAEKQLVDEQKAASQNAGGESTTN